MSVLGWQIGYPNGSKDLGAAAAGRWPCRSRSPGALGAGPSSGSSYFWSGSGSAVPLFVLVVAVQSFHVLGMAGAAAVAAFTPYHAGFGLRCRFLALHLQGRPRPCPCLRLVIQKSSLVLREVDRQLVAVHSCMLHCTPGFLEASLRSRDARGCRSFCPPWACHSC